MSYRALYRYNYNQECPAEHFIVKIITKDSYRAIYRYNYNQEYPTEHFIVTIITKYVLESTL